MKCVLAVLAGVNTALVMLWILGLWPVSGLLILINLMAAVLCSFSLGTSVERP